MPQHNSISHSKKGFIKITINPFFCLYRLKTTKKGSDCLRYLRNVAVTLLISLLTNVSAMPSPISNAVAKEKPNSHDVADTETASITIVANEGQSLIGKQFELFKLFSVENAVAGESVNYTLNPKYASALKKLVGFQLDIEPDRVHEYQIIEYIQTLNHYQVEGALTEQVNEGRYSAYRYFLEELREEMKSQGMSGEVYTVEDTVVTDNSQEMFIIDDLEYGYYLTDEVTENDSLHQASALIMVNTSNPEALINIKSDYPQLIKKIHEDDGNIGWNDIGDYEIGQTVPYKYKTFVPNMSGYHSYYFAFHDRMNKALSFDENSVKIEIFNDWKHYILSEDEYQVITELGEDTIFKIEIGNLKRIVDREWAEELNSDREASYGQQIIVTYNATLNDNASLDTGRPGFENTVRLEFSNDPDFDGQGKTGYTPWDTVVCFTFKLNVSKINNYQKPLAEAKFRLYSDEACENEVYVKENNNGYIVINRDSLGGSDHTGGQAPDEAVEMKSNEDGLFSIIGLDSGTYYLKETDSPNGYRQLESPIILHLKASYTPHRDDYYAGDGATDKILEHLSSSAQLIEFLNLEWHSEDYILETDIEDGSVNLTIINTVLKQLPATGGTNGLIIFAISITLSTTSSALMLAKKKKRIKCDEAKTE